MIFNYNYGWFNEDRHENTSVRCTFLFNRIEKLALYRINQKAK